MKGKNTGSLRHAGKMAHDHVNRLDGVKRNLLVSTLQGLVEGKETHLGNVLNGNKENPITTFTWQGHFELHLEKKTHYILGKIY